MRIYLCRHNQHRCRVLKFGQAVEVRFFVGAEHSIEPPGRTTTFKITPMIISCHFFLEFYLAVYYCSTEPWPRHFSRFAEIESNPSLIYCCPGNGRVDPKYSIFNGKNIFSILIGRIPGPETLPLFSSQHPPSLTPLHP